MSLPALSPIGGYPSRYDIAPSIIYLVLYGCLLPFSLLRIARPKTRNVVQLPVTAAILERILNLTVRLLQATGTWSPTNFALLEYQQITLGWGWIALAQALLPFWRSLVSNATREDDEAGKVVRRRHKLLTYVLDGALWVAQLLGLIGGIYWKLSSRDDQVVRGQWVNPLRYASTSIGMVLVLGLATGVALSRRRLQGIDTKACSYLILISLSFLLIPIYRLTQYHLMTDPSKPLFYAFHMGPEYSITACLIAIDTRRIFGTGAWGDRYFSWRRGWYTPDTKLPPPLFQNNGTAWGWDPEAGDEESLIPKEGGSVSRPPKASFPRFTSPISLSMPFAHRDRPWYRNDSETPETRPPSPALIRDAHSPGCF